MVPGCAPTLSRADFSRQGTAGGIHCRILWPSQLRFCHWGQNPSYDVRVRAVLAARRKKLMAALIELRGLTVELPTPSGWIRPVDDISFSLDAGESLGLVGESGSGKSMLALALMGLLPPGAHVSGEAFFSRANGSSGSRANLLGIAERERIGVRG